MKRAFVRHFEDKFSKYFYRDLEFYTKQYEMR